MGLFLFSYKKHTRPTWFPLFAGNGLIVIDARRRELICRGNRSFASAKTGLGKAGTTGARITRATGSYTGAGERKNGLCGFGVKLFNFFHCGPPSFGSVQKN